MVDKKQEEQLQAKYYEFQTINQQIQQHQQQLQMLEGELAELNSTLEGLKDIEKAKENETILVPIGQGIFSKAQLKDTKNLIVSVGSNILVEKKVSSAKLMMEERKQAVDVYQENTTSSISELAKKAKKLEQELQQILGEVRE